MMSVRFIPYPANMVMHGFRCSCFQCISSRTTRTSNLDLWKCKTKYRDYCSRKDYSLRMLSLPLRSAVLRGNFVIFFTFGAAHFIAIHCFSFLLSISDNVLVIVRRLHDISAHFHSAHSCTLQNINCNYLIISH